MSKEDFEAIREFAKEQHRARVAENKKRLAFALHNLDIEGFVPDLVNTQNCQINVKVKGKTYVFYAGTGKIVGSDRRGISEFISVLKEAD